MFGALNRFIARLDSEPPPQVANQQPNDNTCGFQVLKNTNPDLPLEPWFDFIVGINGHGLDSPDPNVLAAEIRNCAGSICSLDMWSAKGQRTHTLTIPVPPATQPLGAGLLPHSDYILGSPSGTLRGESALGELVEDHLNRSLVLWVYNSEFDVVREVELIPRRGWGGEGALGAVLGYGALHRLPVGLGEEVQAPGENLFDADRKSAEYNYQPDNSQSVQQPPGQVLSPPPMMNPAAPPPMLSPSAPPASRPAAAKKKGRHAPVPGFDDMFAEGQKKSAEDDYVPSRKGTPSAPPPKPGPPPAGGKSQPANDDLGEPGEAEET